MSNPLLTTKERECRIVTLILHADLTILLNSLEEKRQLLKRNYRSHSKHPG